MTKQDSPPPLPPITPYHLLIPRILRGYWRGSWCLVSYMKSTDLGEVLIGESKIHQSKSWYYLGPFQTSKVELSAKIIFGYKS